jgi:acyl-CoA synthetase (AMP-forming)/AMP-acid ligase II
VAICVEGDATLTFGEWERRSNAAAHDLLDHGVRAGQRIALLFGGQDWIDYAIAYFGVLKAGATAIHLGERTEPGEMHRRLAECEVTGMVHASTVPPPDGFSGWTRAVHTLDTERGDQVDVALGPEDVADVLYTSGTTGPAKAFVNRHGTLTFGRGPAGLAKLDVSAPMLAPMPMGTPSSAMCVGMMPLNSPSTVVLCSPDDVAWMAKLIERHRVATILITPWIAMRMVAERVHEHHDLSSVTTVAVASAPLPAVTARALAQMMPAIAVNTAYAQGEAVPAVILNVFDPDRPTDLGRPAPGTDLCVAGEDGEPVVDGEVGEIWLRSAAPKRLYLDQSRNVAVHRDGWTRTGDLGYIGADGDLHLFDRAGDVIRTRGRSVSSIEVEGVLYEHPAVSEAAVIGIPHRRNGQTVAAFVVLASAQSKRELRAFAAERLATHQVPTTWHLLPALPRGITGKVLKHQLRAGLAG